MPDRIEIEITDFGILDVLQKRVKDLRPLLKQIGAFMIGSIQQSFIDQKRGKEIWPPRGSENPKDKVKSISGLLNDLNKGGAIKSRRFEGRPALRDTGNLFNSIKDEIVGESSVQIGSNLTYANDLQRGGDIRIEVTQKAKEGLRKLFRTKPEFEEQLRFLLGISFYQSKIKPRTFVSFEEDDLEEIDKIIGDYLDGMGNPPETELSERK